MPPDDDKQLFSLVYDELRVLAGSYFRQQRGDHTLDPTALVHEVFLKMSSRADAEFADRSHFFAVAATAMRQVLVNHALQRRTLKRGGNRRRMPLSRIGELAVETDDDLIALDEALKRLEGIDPRKSRIVEARFFSGMTVDEIADAIGVSRTTVESDWRLARAWLSRDLSDRTSS